ncbi:MAG: hypothetical protein GY820_47765 [Gammaproteobacteria bacterium]|nr:hypothetical protein [Gammaproteobacteria bacterium]
MTPVGNDEGNPSVANSEEDPDGDAADTDTVQKKRFQYRLTVSLAFRCTDKGTETKRHAI